MIGVEFTMGLIKNLLGNIPLFKDLDEKEINEMMKIAHTRQYKHHMPIFLQGASLNRVYVILKGKVKIFKKDLHGKEQIVWVFKEGDLFPVAGFFGEDKYPANAEAIEDSTLVSIELAGFEDILIHNPEITVKLLKVMGDRLLELQERLGEQILYGTYFQIIKLLLRLCKKYGKQDRSGNYLIETHFSNLELANMVGTSRETISRTLSDLNKKHVLFHEKGGLLSVNIEKLKEKLSGSIN